jgi:hypothetical protein
MSTLPLPTTAQSPATVLIVNLNSHCAQLISQLVCFVILARTFGRYSLCQQSIDPGLVDIAATVVARVTFIAMTAS